jgi:hypothetical protein
VNDKAIDEGSPIPDVVGGVLQTGDAPNIESSTNSGAKPESTATGVLPEVIGRSLLGGAQPAALDVPNVPKTIELPISQEGRDSGPVAIPNVVGNLIGSGAAPTGDSGSDVLVFISHEDADSDAGHVQLPDIIGGSSPRRRKGG